MKYLLVPSTMLPFPPVKGGAVQNLMKFYVEWNEKQKKKNDIVVLSVFDPEAKRASGYSSCKVEYIKLPKQFFTLRDSNNKLFSKIGFKIIDIVYGYFVRKYVKKNRAQFEEIILENTPQFAQRIFKSYNKKLIIHIYNDYLNIDTPNIQAILNCVKKVITVSDYISKRVAATELINNNNIVTLHNGVELEKFGTKKSVLEGYKLREQYNIPKDAIVFIFVARLVPEKGIKELIEAFVRIKMPQAHLVVVGNKLYNGTITDPFLISLKNIAEKMKNNIHFTGYVKYDDLPSYYSMADVGVLPSLYEEPFALAAIEYMASNLAVILTDAGGFPEMVNCKSAFIIKRDKEMIDNLCEKMLYLVENREILKNMQIAAKKNSEKYSSELYCMKLEKILGEYYYE